MPGPNVEIPNKKNMVSCLGVLNILGGPGITMPTKRKGRWFDKQSMGKSMGNGPWFDPPVFGAPKKSRAVILPLQTRLCPILPGGPMQTNNLNFR